MIYPDFSSETNNSKIINEEKIKEHDGFLENTKEEKLMHSVIENDKNTIENGKIVNEMVDYGIRNINSSLLYENLVENYRNAEKLYGETLIREITGYSSDYLKKNIVIPEFRRELKNKINNKLNKLKEDEIIDKKGDMTEYGLKNASIVLCIEELDDLFSKGYGKKDYKKESHYGEKKDYDNFKINSRYKDIAIKRSVRLALRRNHNNINKKDLRVFKRDSKTKISIIYGLDASGSMKGLKLRKAKKAGIALAYKAIDERNDVGLMVFGSEVKKIINPTQDFKQILNALTEVRAGMQTDIGKTIRKSIDLFPKYGTNHLILITDALPTKGDKPKEDTIESAALAKENSITISLIGINLEEEGLELSKKIVEIGNGNLYLVKNLDEIDKLILEDYYSLK
ncbi:VWA domain-containing protein [Candidatus Woesearchaeota archaeon]|nr:VWA domain-containing protein [Candidatus Woesearchaeota archaeon]